MCPTALCTSLCPVPIPTPFLSQQATYHACRSSQFDHDGHPARSAHFLCCAQQRCCSEACSCSPCTLQQPCDRPAEAGVPRRGCSPISALCNPRIARSTPAALVYLSCRMPRPWPQPSSLLLSALSRHRYVGSLAAMQQYLPLHTLPLIAIPKFAIAGSSRPGCSTCCLQLQEERL